MNKSKDPKIPLSFVMECADKAKLFNDFFSNQCKLILNTSSIAGFHFLTDARINSIIFSDTDILNLIRNLNSNKAA